MSTWNDVSRKVLAKAMLDRDALRAMLRHADRDDFSQRYRAVFVAIRNCELAGRPIAVDVLCDACPELKDMVLDLAVEEFTSADQGYWITRLLECEQEERMKQAVSEVEDILLKDQRPFGAKRAEVERRLAQATTVRDASRMVCISEALRMLSDSFGPFVGFDPWDGLVGGLGEGRIHVLAGRPGRGKSTMAVQWCRTASAPAIFVPLEMGEGRIAGIADKQGPSENMQLIANAPMEWIRLRQDIAWAVRESKAKIVAIDHLRYIQYQRYRNQPRWEAVGDLLQDLRVLMRDLKASALVVCQLNRQPEGRRSERPTLADLRESGHVEEQADSVTFLWTTKAEEAKPKANYMLTVAKNRDGPIGGAAIIFDRPGRRFLVDPGAQTEAPF